MTQRAVQRAGIGWARVALGVGFAIALGSCSGGGGSDDSGPPPGGGSCADGQPEFASTWEAVQKLVLEKHGCTEQVCHGSSKAGGLDLSPDVAYRNIFEVRALGMPLRLIEPGDNDRSYLWLKLAAKTNPGSVDINGAPMPNNLPALSAEELELLRVWIYAGAPETGTVIGSEELLGGACLPAPEPIAIKPLDPPAPGEGFQLKLAPWAIPARSEKEVCFATYYDVTDQVPSEYRDPGNKLFRFYGFDLRQDPQSHHLILYYPLDNFTKGVDPHDPAFGAWSCRGGERDGASCDPVDQAACGEGTCASEPKSSFACINYGPEAGLSVPVGGAQQAQAYAVFYPGVFAQIPMKGVIYWNSHAFNLTDKDSQLQGRINYLFAKDQRFSVGSLADFSAIFRPNAKPYTIETFCNDHVLPKGARVFELTSHTHKRGKHFFVTKPDGEQIYESFIYNDPIRQRYDPPLEFDSADPKERTLRYCSTYNNGVKEDGSPDPEFVTRLSRLRQANSSSVGNTCKPVACVSGQIGAACAGEGDDRSCDSSPGAGDGLCDACRIIGGESTENEMMNFFGSYFIDPAGAAAGADDEAGGASVAAAVPPTDARGRSLASEPILPGHMGCATAPGMGGHLTHAMSAAALAGVAGTSAGSAGSSAHGGHGAHAGH